MCFVFSCLPIGTHKCRQINGERPPVHTAATMFQKVCYENKDQLSAGIIVGGWDKEEGPSVYNIPLGGGIFRQPWAIGGKCPSRFVHKTSNISIGSGSTYVYGYCDATFQDGWGRDETVEFVKNSTTIPPLSISQLINHLSSFIGNVS